jgi:non-heme chloroperoxidase
MAGRARLSNTVCWRKETRMPMVQVGADAGTPVELYYESHGSGAPVVLSHGWPLSGRSWERQVPALVAAGFRVITYDRRGFGWSSQPWGGYDYDTFAADLDGLLTHLDVRDATLVGFSMGGGEVARYIGRFGTNRVARAVLAGAVPPYLYKSSEHADGALDDATIAQFEDGVREDRLAFLNGFIENFFKAGDRVLGSEPMRLYARDIAAFASPKGTLDCIGAFSRTDFRGDLSKFRLPTLVIHGDSDAIVPFAVSGKRSHAMIAGARLALIAGGPHGFNVTHAGEFNAEVLDFLRS